MGDGSRQDTLAPMDTRAYIRTAACGLICSVLPSSFPPLFLSPFFPSLLARLGSKQVLQQAKHCATPQRRSVTFSVLGSISRVIIGCLFCRGPATIAAVSLQQGLPLLTPVENRRGLFCRAANGPGFPDETYQLGIWFRAVGHSVRRNVGKFGSVFIFMFLMVYLQVDCHKKCYSLFHPSIQDKWPVHYSYSFTHDSMAKIACYFTYCMVKHLKKSYLHPVSSK